MNGNAFYLNMYLHLSLNDASVAQSISIYFSLTEILLLPTLQHLQFPCCSHFSFFPACKAAGFFFWVHLTILGVGNNQVTLVTFCFETSSLKATHSLSKLSAFYVIASLLNVLLMRTVGHHFSSPQEQFLYNLSLGPKVNADLFFLFICFCFCYRSTSL